MRSAAAAHHLHTTGSEDALPQGLIEVHGLYLRKRNLRHLDVEDAVLLYETCVRNGKLSASADNSPYNPDEEGKHEQSDACVEKSILLLRELVVCQYNCNDATYRKEQRIEKIPEDVGPMKSPFEDNCFAFLEALFDVIRHNPLVLQGKDNTFLLTKQETRQKVCSDASFLFTKSLSLQKHYTLYN